MLVTPAYAQTPAGGGAEIIMSILPFILIFVIMYFLIIRPQRQQMKKREEILKNIRRALKPEGKFVLDVSTREHRQRHGNRNGWYAARSGFWKPGPHLVLEEGFDYPEQSIWLDQYTVIEADGKVSVYRNWFQDYTPETITQELARGGFTVEGLWGDLTGEPYTESSEWIGLLTRKV